MPVPAVLPPALAALPVRRKVPPPEQLRAHARGGNLCADWDPKREVLPRTA